MSDPAIPQSGAQSEDAQSDDPAIGVGAKAVRAFAPASVANVACGFDALGFAVAGIGDVVTARRTDPPGVIIEQIVGNDEKDPSRNFTALPTEPARNTASVAAQVLIDCWLRERAPADATEPGVALRIEKGIPAGSGLGSSAASAAAAAVAVDALLGLDSSRDQLFDAALAGEAMVSRAQHGDNVAPALEGGFQLVRLETEPRCIRLPVPTPWRVVLMRPHLVIETAASRGTIGSQIALADACFHWGNTAALVAGLFHGDATMVRGALHDRIAEPARAPTVPRFAAVKAAATAAGALGCSLSGSGPTLFALCTSAEDADRVAQAMVDAFAPAGLTHDLFLSPVGTRGAHLLDHATDPSARHHAASSHLSRA